MKTGDGRAASRQRAKEHGAAICSQGRRPQALVLTVPPAILARADEVIE